MTAEQRLAERQLKTKPLLKSLESWLREKMKTLSRHSELAKAFAYALNQWPALTYYADDGWAEADNNIAENALRMVSLGRKNYLFFGYLINKAKGIITDSGNVAEEATFLGIPCITLNTYAEHPETWRMGTNELVGEDPALLAKTMDTLMHGEWKRGELPERWDGRTAERIVQILTSK